MPPPPTETSPLCDEDPHKSANGNWLRTLRLVAISGAGLLADGYDLQVVNLVMAIMQHVYGDKMGPAQKSLTATTTLVGVIIGQVSFGALADVTGRKLASIATAALTIVGAIISACVVDSPHMAISLQLALCRLPLGLGVGGEYPLSAALGKEAEGKGLRLSRPQLLACNMLLYNMGAVLQASFVAVLLKAAVPLEVTWRLALAGGAVPSICVLVLRAFMDEPEARARERAEAAHGGGRARGYFTNLAAQVACRQSVLFGACVSWFLFNFTAYGHGNFSSIICDRLFGKNGDSAVALVMRDAIFALTISGLGVIGNLIGFLMAETVSLRMMQATCFVLMAVPLWIIGWLNGHVTSSGFLAVLYMFCVFMMPFIGITTYLVPTEHFPASARGTCVGIAAASGKLGGVVGTALFPIWEARYGLSMVMVSSGIVSLLGAFTTVMFTPATRAEDARAEKNH